MEEKDYILFDQYVLGELPTEELKSFEERLKIDSEFNNSFKTYRELTTFLETKFENEKETSDFKSNLEQISNSHFNQNKTNNDVQSTTRTITLVKYLVVACVAVFFGIFAFNQFSDPTYSDFNNHDPLTVIRDGNTSDLVKATQAFNSKDYTSANALLKSAFNKNPKNSELKLYYAITNIELDNFKIADNALNELKNGISAYKDKATWYLALSKLKQKKISPCIALLKEIPKDADYYEQAQQLLSDLE